MKTLNSADLFSDVLRLANPQPVLAGGFTAGGDWAIRFPAPEYLKFFALMKGACWLVIDGEPPVKLREGDVILMSHRQGFILASEPGVEPCEAKALFSGLVEKRAVLGEGADCVQLGGHVRLDAYSGALLQDALPSLIHIHAGQPESAVLQWLLDQLVQEYETKGPGNVVFSAHLTQLMFLHILRIYMETTETLPAGWLRAICSPKLSGLLAAIHQSPEENWTLEEMARRTAMSRTRFALWFKEVMGLSPQAYVTHWRMNLARTALRDEAIPLSQLMQRCGYSSESAFSTAFKRHTGVSPSHYRQSLREA